MTAVDLQTAMVFAAGRGERMAPLSQAFPKPALPTPSGPVVCSPLRLAAATGCRHIAVNIWHLADLMEAAVAGCMVSQLETACCREPELMGTAGGLALARDRGLLGSEGPVLVLNGDGVLELSLDSLIHRFATSGDLVSLALLPHPDPGRWSRVTLDGRGVVDQIFPPGSPASGETPLLFPGVMLVSRHALNTLDASPHGVAEGLWAPARAAGRLGGAVVTGRWREVGTPSDYLATVLGQLDGSVVIDPSALVDPGAELGATFIGPEARVEAGAAVGESVVAGGAVVRRGARVIRSVLMGAVEAFEGDSVVDEFRSAPLSSSQY